MVLTQDSTFLLHDLPVPFLGLGVAALPVEAAGHVVHRIERFGVVFTQDPALLVATFRKRPSTEWLEALWAAHANARASSGTSPRPATRADRRRYFASNEALVDAIESGDVEELLELVKQKPVKIEIVKATYGAGDKQKDVTDVLKKLVSSFPSITLPNGNYNAAFGGDPAPGVPKKLTVAYKFDGKDGEAVFAENAPILLTMPK